MTRPIEQTLNVSVAQIEAALLDGVSVPDFAQQWSEPAANVLAVFRRLQREGRIPTNAPTQVASRPPTPPASGPRPLASVPTTPVAASAPSVEALVAAAGRSESKRTQALGKKLDDLAAVLRQRLTDERFAAEQAAKERAEREAAAAEVARLEAELKAAREKAGLPRRAGATRAPREAKPLSDAQRAAQAKAVAAGKNTEPCANGCGYVSATKAGKKAHERGSKCPGSGDAA